MLRWTTYLNTLATLAAISTAIEFHKHHSHGQDTEVDYNQATGETLTFFSPDYPVCGNDHRLTDTGLRTDLPLVNTRPDCDTVINTICSAADAAMKETVSQNVQSLYSTSPTCEGYILFSNTTYDASYLNYIQCVIGFQAITDNCMLMGDPNDAHNYASPGLQFGVTNVFHDPQGGAATKEAWSACTKWNDEPGYMIGPVGLFGQVDAQNASDVLTSLGQPAS